MTDKSGPLGPEDYVEPRCVLCGEPYGAETVQSVPQQRIIEKMDEYMARRDYAGAERHLLYWLAEAELGHDARGRLMLLGELIGHYRKTGEREKALRRIDEALALVEEMDYGGTISAGTTWVNAATALERFDEPARALALFEKARAVYEGNGQTAPQLLGGLYNNMALVLVTLRRFGEAYALYDKAMARMADVPGGALEQAITCLNRADALASERGAEAAEAELAALLDRAWTLLHAPDVPKNGYCAFVYEKCAPSFSYYGRFADALELKKEAEELYDRA
jgi:tetratricopeptide (TPR) repeat protein